MIKKRNCWPIFNLQLLTYIFVLILVSACSHKMVKQSSDRKIVIFPPPPDTTRIQYLTKFSSSADVVGYQSRFSKFVLGQVQERLITKPYGVAIKKGQIYICDTYVKGLEIIDLEKKTFGYFIPDGKGALKLPINCFVDDNETIYVADAERMQIVVFDKDKNYLTCFGEAEKFKPTDVFVYDNKVWVTNILNNKIHVYDALNNNELLYTFPEVEKGSMQSLFSPTNIFVDQNKVYVSDFGDFKIKMYNHNGDFIDTLGSYGKNIGQFARPKGVAVDKQSNIYVVDAAFENVQIFNKQKKIMMFFGGNYDGPGKMWLPAKVVIDYDNLDYFKQYVDPSFDLKYIIFVTNQYGPDKISVYGFVEPKKQ